MVIDYVNDGKIINEKFINQNFQFNSKDFRRDENNNNVITFVGYTVNNENDMLVSFPKHFIPTELDKDTNVLLKTIFKHMKNYPDKYIGDKSLYSSNYPFTSFFNVYNYYIKYGLLLEDEIKITTKEKNKINWKKSIKDSNKYIQDNGIILYPLFYNNQLYFKDLIAKCVTFVINYTSIKFGNIIKTEVIDFDIDYEMFISNKEYIVNELLKLQTSTFNDNLLYLLNNLILFFKEINEGGNIYIKHYNYEMIWEDMVKKYLSFNYSDIKDKEMIFKYQEKPIIFKNEVFRPNLANEFQYIQPDYYYENDKLKLIFDAKYYEKINGLNYKQVVYYLLLNEFNSKHKEMFCALILPSEETYTKVHFRMNPFYNTTYKDMVIYETFLDIKIVMDFYLFQNI